MGCLNESSENIDEINNIKIADICKKFSRDFLEIYENAEDFYEEMSKLEEKELNYLNQINQGTDSELVEECNQKISEYKNKKTAIYKALAIYTIYFFEKMSVLNGTNRTILLKETQVARDILKKIVNYHDFNASTVLSKLECYCDLCKAASVITLIEMSEHFDKAHKSRTIMLSKLIELNDTKEKHALLLDLSKLYNAIFFKCLNFDVDTFEFKYVLVNHYTRYLENFLELGGLAHKIIFDVDIRCKTWYKCLPIITALGYDSRVSKKKKVEWHKLCTSMTQIIKDFTNK